MILLILKYSVIFNIKTKPFKTLMENISKNKILLAAPDAIIVISHDRKIITFNEAAERITGYKKNDIIHTDFQILFRNSDQDIKYLSSSLEENKSHVNITLNLTTAHYTIISVLATISPNIQPAISYTRNLT